MRRRPSIVYFLAEHFILPFYWLFVRTVIEGEHFLPHEGPVVLVSNHISFIDPISLGYLGRRRKRQIHFLAKDSLFKNPLLGRFFRACRQIPVERGTERAADSLIHARESLEHGHVVGIFPESTMPEDLVQLPLKSGALRLAAETGAQIIVVGAWGAQDTWRKGKKPHPRFRMPHALVVLPPYEIPVDADIEHERDILADKMRDATSKARAKIGERS